MSRERPAMLHVSEFLRQLDEPEHLNLANAVGSGLRDARMAAQCLTDPGPQAETVPQMLAYLTRAIKELASARELIKGRLEQVDEQPGEQLKPSQ
jgi:hypothetical protein